MGVIRLLLAIAVVVGHSGGNIYGFKFIGGRMAVESFFIISGFYMAMVLNEKYVGKSKSYRLFISNRFLRLYPLYWITLILSICYSLFAYYALDSVKYSTEFAPNVGVYVHNILSLNLPTIGLIFFANIFIFLQDLLLFLQLNPTTGNLEYSPNFLNSKPILATFMFVQQAWSISLELMFYLIAPFILRKKMQFIVGLLLVLTALRMYLIYGEGLTFDPWTYRFFPIELPFFLLGSISYAIYKKLTSMAIKDVHLNLGSYFLVALVLLVSAFHVPKMIYFFFFVILLPIVFIRTKHWKLDTIIGELSYPVYLVHMLLLVVIESSHLFAFGSKSLVLVLLSILLSVALNELVSKPIESIRANRIKN